MALNQATKYGLFFVGGIAVGALGMALVSRGKLNIKPLATDLLASGIDLRDKALAAVDGVKEDLADVVAEAQVKQRKRKKLRKRRKLFRLPPTADFLCGRTPLWPDRAINKCGGAEANIPKRPGGKLRAIILRRTPYGSRPFGKRRRLDKKE